MNHFLPGLLFGLIGSLAVASLAAVALLARRRKQDRNG